MEIIVDAKPHKHKIWKLSELKDDQTVSPPGIIEEGILNSQSLLLITGQPKAKKSFLVMNLAAAIAAGRSFAGFIVSRPLKVFVFSAEGGFYSNRDRIRKICKLIPERYDDNLYMCFGSRLKLDDDGDYKEICAMIDEIKPDVVIMDPLVKFHNQDENSAQGMSIVLDRLRKIIEEKNVSIILVHHLGKNGGQGARGSSAILGEYDSNIQIEKHKDSQKLVFDLRHAEPKDPRNIKFNNETFWFEAESCNYPVTSILERHGEMEKGLLAKQLVKEKHNSSLQGAYNRIKKELKNGAIVEQNKKLRLR
jgi:RecA-family ATPase